MGNNQTTEAQVLVAEFKERFIQKWNAFDTKDEFWRPLFTVHPSTKSEEVDIEQEEMKFYGMSQFSLVQANKEIYSKRVTRYEHKSFDLQFKVLLEKAKNGWSEEIEEQSLAVFNTMRQQLAKEASSVFDNMIKEDTLALSLTNASFSMTAYQEAVISLSDAKDIEGFYVTLKPKALMITPKLQSTIYDHISPEDLKGWNVKVVINPYLKNPDSWFLITDAKNGLKCFERQAPDLSVVVTKDQDLFLHNKPNPDFKPEMIFKISARYSFGCTNPNAVFASTGTGESK
jgi:hypothetical protein